MEIKYQRRHDETYMVIDGCIKPDSHELKMLKSNEIKSLLSFYTMNVEGKVQFWHEITGLTSLKDYVSQRGLSVELIEKLLTYLQMAYSQISGFLIAQEHILLLPETIYIENKKGSFLLRLCYYPEGSEPATKQFMDVLEFFLSVVDGKDKELAGCVYELYDVASSTDYSLGSLINCINERCIGIKSREEKKAADDKEIVDEDEESVFDFRKEMEESYKPTAQKSFLSKLFGNKKQETSTAINLIEDGPLADENEVTGRLIYDGDRDEDNFLIDEDVFLLGRNFKSANGRIKSDSVSSLHARIMRAGRNYYIEDARSEHGTYVNGRLLRQGERYPLKAMDRLCFGDVNYIFM